MEKSLAKVEMRALMLNGSMLVDNSMNVNIALDDIVMYDDRVQADKTELSK